MGSSDSDDERRPSKKRNKKRSSSRDRHGRKWKRSTSREKSSRRSRSKERTRRRSKSPSSSRRSSKSHSAKSSRRSSSSEDSSRRSKSAKKTDTKLVEKILAAREKMRSDLAMAESSKVKTELTETPQSSKIVLDLSNNDSVARQQEIDRIEGEGFQQQDFLSSRGGAAPITSSTVFDTKQSEHDRAIFGTAAAAATQEPNEEVVRKFPENRANTFSLAHENLHPTPERQKKWVQRWQELRNAALLAK